MKKILCSMKRMLPYLKGRVFFWISSNLLDVVGLAVFSVLTASALEAFIDAIAGLNVKFLYDGMGKLGLALVVMFLCEGLYKRLFLDTITYVKVSMQKALFEKILRIPCRLNEDEKTGEKMVRLNQDVEISLEFIGEKFTSLISGVVMSLVSVICIGSKSWILGILSAVILAGILFVNFFYQPKQKGIASDILEKQGVLNVIFSEALSGGVTIRTNRLQKKVGSVFEERIKEFLICKRRERNLRLQQNLLGNGLSRLLVLILLGLGAVLCTKGEMNVGSLFFVFQFGMNLLGYASQICDGFVELSKAESGVERYFEQMEEAEETSFYGEKEIEEEHVSIHLKNIGIRYENGKTLAYKDMEFCTGEYVAVVGKSGTGKSSLLNVLSRFIEYEGDYTINGNDAKQYRLKEFRKLFSYVPQKPELLNGTIRENIMAGRREASEEEMYQAAKMAGADTFIEKLPGKYAFRISEKEGNLSGGERQRIALARALLKNAPILLLDECTASLDLESEERVKKGLEYGREGRITIMIAHRRSMIDSAQRVIEL